MKNGLLIVVILLFLRFYCFSAEFPFRTWTSSSGVRIQARLISKNADKLTIERSDSKQFVLPLSLLSTVDQSYVQNITSGGNSQAKRTVAQRVSNTLPIWSPAVMEKWWQMHKGGDFKKLSSELLSSLR